jgi:molecular chaperone HtpG
MSEVIAQISLANLAPRPKPIDGSVYVGKDILDLLTGSMYLDPLNVFREYIQNAADSIDEARSQGLQFPQGPQITFEFNQQERSVKIKDCGMGIPAMDFVRRLTTIGASGKRGTKQRGFRGVGRLSGLGYCQELIFRSRAEGESKVSELRWDVRILREKMRDPAFVGGLADIVATAVTQTKLPADGFPDRFFEVEMRKVQRLRNDLLLNEVAIKSYLSQVAPVPFSPDFSFGNEIQARLEKAGVARTVDICFIGDQVPVYHRGSNSIAFSGSLTDKISSIEWIEYFGVDGELVAIGWLGQHSYAGAIPNKLGLGGLRLRAGNIQIGDEAITAPLFTESRFVGWVVGDIHVVSPKIAPNGRRDEFEVSVHYTQLQNQLTMTMKEVTQQIRTRSLRRNRLKQVHIQLSALEGWMAIHNEGVLDSMLASAINEVAADRLQLALHEATKLEPKSDEREIAENRIQAVKAEFKAVATKIRAGAFEKRLASAATPIKTALKTILASSPNPKKGVSLAKEVLAAVKASHPT